MSNFYDPWAHSVHLFLMRLMQFLMLSAVLSLAIWAGLLHWYVPNVTWTELAQWSWEMAREGKRHWLAVYAVCLCIAGLLVSLLFTTVSLLSRLRGGERHHRGSHVVHHEQD